MHVYRTHRDTGYCSAKRLLPVIPCELLRNKAIVEVNSRFERYQGTYLFSHKGCFVRSGKVSGSAERTLWKRVEEHRQSALEKQAPGSFYEAYREDPNQTHAYTGVPINVNASLEQRWQALKRMHWPMETIQALKRRGIAGKSWKENALTLETYFFETVLELCMAPSSVLSEAPGMESFIGYQGSKHNVRQGEDMDISEAMDVSV